MIGFLDINRHIIHLLDPDMNYGFGITSLQQLWMIWNNWEMFWGIVIIPVIMQPYWFNRFLKVTDIYLFIPAGSITEWPANMQEALTIGIYLPF